MTRQSVNVDADQFDALAEYCIVSGASKAHVVREALADWLRERKPGRMKSFNGKKPRAKKEKINAATL